MSTNNEINFSSFLAGCLMKHNQISYVELSNLMAKFELEYNLDFVDDYSDYNFSFISNMFTQDDNGFKLRFQYDENFIINGDSYTVYDYLYSFTDENVRNFFNIIEKEIVISKGVNK